MVSMKPVAAKPGASATGPSAESAPGRASCAADVLGLITVKSWRARIQPRRKLFVRLGRICQSRPPYSPSPRMLEALLLMGVAPRRSTWPPFGARFREYIYLRSEEHT